MKAQGRLEEDMHKKVHGENIAGCGEGGGGAGRREAEVHLMHQVD